MANDKRPDSMPRITTPELANAFIEDSRKHYSPVKGTPEQLEEIRKLRSVAKDGYGLLNNWKKKYSL